jgi:hypothetical protein
MNIPEGRENSGTGVARIHAPSRFPPRPNGRVSRCPPGKTHPSELVPTQWPRISRQSVNVKSMVFDLSTVAFNPDFSTRPYLSGMSFLAFLMAFW